MFSQDIGRVLGIVLGIFALSCVIVKMIYSLMDEFWNMLSKDKANVGKSKSKSKSVRKAMKSKHSKKQEDYLTNSLMAIVPDIAYLARSGCCNTIVILIEVVLAVLFYLQIPYKLMQIGLSV